MGCADRFCIWVAVGKPVQGGCTGNALCGLAGFQRLGSVQPVERPARMGFQIGEWFIFLDQLVKNPCKQAVLVDIGQIPGVINMLVRQHRTGLAPRACPRKSG